MPASGQTAAALLAVLALLAGPPAAAQTASSIDRTTINVCTSSYTPMVDCDPDTDPATWSGYEVEVFRRVLDRLGWSDNKNITIKWYCMDWEVMLDGLLVGDGTNASATGVGTAGKAGRAQVRCDISAAGVQVSVERVASGIVFSWPTFKNGMGVSVDPQVSNASFWAFTNAFQWQVWLAIGLTAIAVAFIAFGIDACLLGARRRGPKLEAGPPDAPDDERKTLDNYMWEAIGRPMQTRDATSLSLPANLVILFFAFLCLVLVTVYTANTTANITTTRLQSTITGVQDLPGKRVGTWNDYLPQLRKYGIIAEGFPWETADDEEAMFSALSSGKIQALVLDNSLLVHRASNSCDLAVVGPTFDDFDQAVALSSEFAGANPKLLDAVNGALIALREDGILTQLEEDFVDPPESSCKKLSVAEGSSQVSFSQVAGLWIMLAGGIGAALVLAGAVKLHERYTQHHVDRALTQLKRQVTRVVTGSSRSGGRAASGRRGQLDTSGLDLGIGLEEGGFAKGGGLGEIGSSEDDGSPDALWKKGNT